MALVAVDALPFGRGESEMSDNPATGGCPCGAVRIEAAGAPYRVGLCHCLDCRKRLSLS